MFANAGMVKQEDIQSGWVYVLKSKSTNPDIASIKDLHKIGFSSTDIDDRIKNAKHEATYLFADVVKVVGFKVYNMQADKLEQLIQRFFASACLNIDIYSDNGQRATPREWFIIPLDIINRAIELVLNGQIVKYKYDEKNKIIVEK